MTTISEEIIKIVSEARINDFEKKFLILSLAKAKTTLDGYDYEKLAKEIKEKVLKKEKELN